MHYEFVVNLHVTERCNFSCSYCFGKWGIATGSELFENVPLAQELIRDVVSVFPTVPLKAPSMRFNFVGGEPALLRSLPELVGFCRALGARTSFVTNGLMLQHFSPSWLARNFDIAGLSIDSISQERNRLIGRSTRSGATLDLDKIGADILELKSLGTAVKVNTVVSAVNCDEDFSEIIRKLCPDKWKIFQMLPVYDGRSAVSTEDFGKFIARHKEFEEIMFTEDNDEMTGSYAMIDPLGRFFWYEGAPCSGYKYSQPILQVGAAEAFSQSTMAWLKYAKRYKQ